MDSSSSSALRVKLQLTEAWDCTRARRIREGEDGEKAAEEVKAYIRYIADRRLTQLGLQPIYRIESNPLPWLDEMLNGVEHTNFFENRATEYSKAATRGTWEEAFD